MDCLQSASGIWHLHISVFCNDPAPTQIYTLSLHDALPISEHQRNALLVRGLFDDLRQAGARLGDLRKIARVRMRSEEHTSELQSLRHLVCRLLLEKKNGT